jgi:hypothetical protein
MEQERKRKLEAQAEAKKPEKVTSSGLMPTEGVQTRTMNHKHDGARAMCSTANLSDGSLSGRGL